MRVFIIFIDHCIIRIQDDLYSVLTILLSAHIIFKSSNYNYSDKNDIIIYNGPINLYS